MPDEKEIKVELPESVTKALAEVERLSAELAKLTKPADVSGDKLSVSADSTQREIARIETDLAKAHEALRKELEVRAEELKQTQEQLQKSIKQRRRERFIKRAEELTHLPGTRADDFAETLDLLEAGLAKTVPDRAAKVFEKFNNLLTAWDTLVEKNELLFKEIGSNGGEFGMLSGAEAQIEALAQEKRAADPKLSLAKARTLVIEENPALYAKYRREQGRK